LEVVVLLHALHQSVMVLIQYFQLSQQQVVVMEHLIEHRHKMVDQVVVEHQETVQQVLVMYHLQTHLKVIVVKLEQEKDQFHLELVEVVEVQLLQEVDLTEVQEHLILLLDLT
tara:strand:- start:160 stop:498 length:339 start_codon:yes stop_codon:yes gene_type:complete